MASKLKLRRVMADITQKDLALKAGVKAPTLSAHERRGVKNVDQAKKYAKLLRCSPLDLLEF